MKNLLLPILLMCSISVMAQTPCNGGMAGPYPCNGYNLLAHLDLNTLNAGSGNDSWGWTDPATGKEYALMALSNGTAFIDISNPTSPIYLGKLPTHTSNSSWRDVKTYDNHAFIVSEASGHGMQVFDLTRLRSVPNPPVTFNNDAHYSGFGRAHNIVINEDTGYAYAVGTSTFNGGPHFVNIQNPTNPTAAGGYPMDDYSHDAQIVTYCGPDKDYSGREILFGSNENEVIIADITDKANPISISSISYSNVEYTHQGWFTEDQRYFLVGDELDETSVGFNTRTIVFDFEDLDNPQLFFEYTGPTPAIDHNGYVKGTKYYMANYRAGMRVIDVADIANGNISEEGFFDTYPANDNANFSGAWSIYPYFESGNIVISDINRGFFVVKAQNPDLVAPVASCQNITVSLNNDGNATITASQVDNGSSDNSGTVYLKICNDTFDCGDLGANLVELEVYDDFGNKDYCTANVTVVDDIDPEMSCPGNSQTLPDTGQDFYTLPDYVANNDVTASDNCESDPSISQDPAPGTELPIGVHTISFEATDGNGNAQSCSFNLTVTEVLQTSTFEFEEGLSLYPNPVTEILNIHSGTSAIETISVVDISGKLILQLTALNAVDATLDLSSISRGIYFVRVNDIVTKKIVKR
ncbi:choice-of-anchor B family protein [Aureitalea sp. L0-47]|uniref:choice-of-anchor B family protein n=1 Tax=Aureitalea sp. L0-47 TaxID=2816962 RepID=UPI002AA2A4D4|nr:choice-of-anchor B family protein [Aureitalea sp. L0-47]MCW5518326.1 choice-of-anchor B family protein [Aureitalea sp. L0-47]